MRDHVALYCNLFSFLLFDHFTDLLGNSCFLLGLSVFLLGLVPVLVAILTDHARGYRAIGLPFFLLGASISAMALQKICAVIWLLWVLMIPSDFIRADF